MKDKEKESEDVGLEEKGYSLSEIVVSEVYQVPETETPKMTPEQIASRQRAHDIKVVKFLAGGEF